MGSTFLLVALMTAGTSQSLQLLHGVAAAINEYPQYTIFDTVDATIDGGVVTLTGKVTRPNKRDDLEAWVRRVQGVRDVRNEVDVLPVSIFDDELRQRIARSIYGNSNFRNYAIMPNPPIHIIVENGRVWLKGVVQTDVDRALARALASQFGAFAVINELRTAAEVRNSSELH